MFSNLRDRVESRIDAINVDVTVDADRKIRVSGNARSGGQPLKFAIKATAPPSPLERQNIPAEFTFDAAGLLPARLSARAEVRLNGNVVMINGVTGALGDGDFSGWASVDLASKPLVKLDLDFQRLDACGISRHRYIGAQAVERCTDRPQQPQLCRHPGAHIRRPSSRSAPAGLRRPQSTPR